MNKNILVIIADFDPYPSSNTNCIKPLLKRLLLDGYRVDIVTRRMDTDSLEHECKEGFRIWRVDDIRCINTIRINRQSKLIRNPIHKIIYKIYSVISKTYVYMKYCMFSNEKRVAGWKKTAVIEKIKRRFINEDFGIILSIALPEITHEIAWELKKTVFPNSKWIIYDYDPICYNTSQFGNDSERKFYAKQNAFYELCDKICIGPELFEYYMNKPFAKYREKMHVLPFANMTRFDSDRYNIEPVEREKIVCTYAGALAKDIRNPQYTVDLFSQSGISKLCELYIITGSRTEYIKINSEIHNIFFIERLPREEVISRLMGSSILINIGNTVTFQVPGKIFEYMAIGKPIIHISKIANDPTCTYLEKYPYKLIIHEMDDIENNEQKIISFVNENKNNLIDYDSLQKIMSEYTEESISNRFVKIVDELVAEYE